MDYFELLDLPFSDPVLIFGLVMVIILVVPILAKKLRTPDIVGLIFAEAVNQRGG